MPNLMRIPFLTETRILLRDFWPGRATSQAFSIPDGSGPTFPHNVYIILSASGMQGLVYILIQVQSAFKLSVSLVKIPCEPIKPTQNTGNF